MERGNDRETKVNMKSGPAKFVVRGPRRPVYHFLSLLLSLAISLDDLNPNVGFTTVSEIISIHHTPENSKSPDHSLTITLAFSGIAGQYGNKWNIANANAQCKKKKITKYLDIDIELN